MADNEGFLRDSSTDNDAMTRFTLLIRSSGRGGGVKYLTQNRSVRFRRKLERNAVSCFFLGIIKINETFQDTPE